MDTQTDRASEIIRGLTAFDQRPEISPRQVDLNETIRDVVRIVDHQLHLEDIELRLDLDQRLPTVLGHQNRFGQLIYVLVENAEEAVNERDKKCDSDHPRYIEIRSAAERNEIVVTVSDSGVGIPEQLKKRIFEPFFSTKETGKGRGLGLSVVRQIVKDYGGQITFEGQYCRGSTFKITFPLRKNL